MRLLLRLLRRHWFAFSSSLALAFVISWAEGVAVGTLSPLLRVLFRQEGAPPFLKQFPWLARLVERELLSVSPVEAVAKVAAFMVLVYLVKFLASYFQRLAAAAVQEGVVRDVRNWAFEKLVNMPLWRFSRWSSGDVMSRFTSDAELLKRAFSEGLGVILTEGLKGVAYLAVALLASWQLTLFAGVTVPVTSVLITWVSRKLRKRTHRAQSLMGRLNGLLYEVLGGLKVVKGFGAERREAARFSGLNSDYYRAMMRAAYVASVGPPLTELLTALVAAAMLVYSAHLIFIQGSLTPDQFMVFLVAALSLMRPLKVLFQANTPVQQGLVAARRLEELLGEPEEPTGSRPFEGLREGIELRDVWFSYEPGVPVLKGVNLRIKKGEKVALVGPSGAGKSTLADLIAGFLRPQRGQVLVDGVPLSQLDIHSYREFVAVVPQEVFLFSGTVAENIAYGKPGATRKEVIEAAKVANAHEFIVNLPQGYDTPVGERGARLSGGQRQRIAIARAVIKDPDIVILDEATSALDAESEEAVKRALDRALAGRTAVIIAHRLSTVLQADKIVVLEGGRVLDVGKHEELLERCRVYRRYSRLQLVAR